VPEVQSPKRRVSKAVVYFEDGLIVLSVGLLFWLGVLNRQERWARVAMLPVLGMMLVVFVHRMFRVHRAMRGGW